MGLKLICILQNEDSDLEVDPDYLPNWQTSILDPYVVAQLDDRARRRHNVLMELFHTERTHVRTLKVVYRVFYLPIVQRHLLPAEVILRIFANLEEMISIHSVMNKQMRILTNARGLIGDVGELFLLR